MNRDGFVKVDTITRVEIIDDSGRVYANRKCKNVQLHIQDNVRTMKIFLDKLKEEQS